MQGLILTSMAKDCLMTEVKFNLFLNRKREALQIRLICHSIISGALVASPPPVIEKRYPATGDVIAHIEQATTAVLDILTVRSEVKSALNQT